MIIVKLLKYFKEELKDIKFNVIPMGNLTKYHFLMKMKTTFLQGKVEVSIKVWVFTIYLQELMY